jgi:O-succinylbenzoate synthase
VSITVKEVTLFHVAMPLVREFETSSHKKSFIEHILVRATDSDGFVGWGECASPSDPYFCYESTATCWLMLEQYLVPSLLGATWDTPGEAVSFSHVNGHPFAHAAIEMACWDLYAQHLGQPLADVLGGDALAVEAGVSLGIESTVDKLLEVVALHVNDGYRRVKLKITPGWDVEPSRAVRTAFPDVALQVDANGGYENTERSNDVLTQLDALELLMIEQPFHQDDLVGHAVLQARLDTPLCLDESITSLEAARTALTLEACRVINIKVSRLGGLGHARDVHDFCRVSNVPVWCGGMHEFGIGRAANLALAGLPGFLYPSDLSGSKKYYEQDLVSPEIVARDGRVVIPRGKPGLGVDVLMDRVEAHVVKKSTHYAEAPTRGARTQ